MGVRQLWEFLQDLRHLVPSLPTAHVDHDLGIAPFGDLMLRDRLARPESAGDGRSPTSGQREEGIQHALSGDQELIGRHAELVGARSPHGPALQHGDGLLTAPRFQAGDGVFDGILPLRRNPGEISREVRRDHDAVLDQWRLRHRAQDRTALHRRPDGNRWRERPFLLAVQRRCFDAPPDERSASVFQDGQGALDAVEDALQQARPQLDGEGHAGAINGSAGTQPCGLFVDLDGEDVALQSDDFADQVFLTDLDDFEHAHIL